MSSFLFPEGTLPVLSPPTSCSLGAQSLDSPVLLPSLPDSPYSQGQGTDPFLLKFALHTLWGRLALGIGLERLHRGETNFQAYSSYLRRDPFPIFPYENGRLPLKAPANRPWERAWRWPAYKALESAPLCLCPSFPWRTDPQRPGRILPSFRTPPPEAPLKYPIGAGTFPRYLQSENGRLWRDLHNFPQSIVYKRRGWY